MHLVLLIGLKYLWLNKSLLPKSFDNAMENTIIIMWTVWITEITLSLMVLIIIPLVLFNWRERLFTKGLSVKKVWLLTLLVYAKRSVFTYITINIWTLPP